MRGPGLVSGGFMFALMLAEVGVLSEIVFSDFHRVAADGAVTPTEIYFYVVLATCVLQAAGLGLVMRGHYRIGGALQIAASAVHLIKIEGLIGIFGGMRAYRAADVARGLPLSG